MGMRGFDADLMKVAVIPARGGSKRIPRKNIRDFLGRPVICHSIDCALNCGVFDRVIVSTDDPEISSVSLAAGAEVPFVRPIDLSDDDAVTTAVISIVIGVSIGQGNQQPSIE